MPMQQTAPEHADLRCRGQSRPRWRLAVLITVLAGFFLMHGLSGADSCAGALALQSAEAQTSVAMVTANSATAQAVETKTAETQSAETKTVVGGGSSHTSPADQCCAAMGTLCIPQRPQDDAWILVLLLGLAMLVNGEGAGRLMDEAIARTARARRRRHPGSAIPTRLLVCVSRT